MRRTAALAALAVVLLAGNAHAQGPLTGPSGSGHSKVLVIGVDGARWDLVKRAMDEGRAPNLARLSREGVAGPTLLPYTPPTALTISEVGWSTIAAGVGPAKHGINGFLLNNDPRQATKNGYADFLTRAESVRPAVSTFLASDWANIGLPRNGGPIFGSAIDARHALAGEDSVDSYNRGDAEVTGVSARYLYRGNPDAGFVYLGVVDEIGAPDRVGHARLPGRDRAGGQAHRLPVGLDPPPPDVRPRAVDGDRDHRPRPVGLELPEHVQPRRPERARAHVVRVRGRAGDRRAGRRTCRGWWTSRPRWCTSWASR